MQSGVGSHAQLRGSKLSRATGCGEWIAHAAARRLTLRCHRCLLVGVVLAASLPAGLGAQSRLVLMAQDEARAHLVSAPPPVFPSIAQAARVEGVVDVEIEIAPDGTVTQAQVLFGVPLLDFAALEAAQRWRFEPFVSGGTPVSVRTGLTFFFVLSAPSQSHVAAAVGLNDAILLCLHHVDQRAFAEAEHACLAAASVSARIRPSRTAPALAARLLGDSLAGLGRHDEAIVRFRAVLDMSSAVSSDRDRALADRGVGRSLAAIGRVDDALKAYDRAQDRLTDMMNAVPRGSPYRAGRADQLRPVLIEYVELLDRAGDARRAQRMRDRLGSLP
jgi:TonB family protein